jgi:hypothetical protein
MTDEKHGEEIEWTDDDEAVIDRMLAKEAQRKAQSRFVWQPGQLVLVPPVTPPAAAPLAGRGAERARALQKRRTLRKAR